MNVEKLIWEKLFEKDTLIYEGYTINNCPYGQGTSFYSNGNIFQKGIFAVKGFVRGKIYHSNGNILFEGDYKVNRAYGPNYPIRGKVYSKKGKLIHSGEFDCKTGGVG